MKRFAPIAMGMATFALVVGCGTSPPDSAAPIDGACSWSAVMTRLAKVSVIELPAPFLPCRSVTSKTVPPRPEFINKV